MPLNLTERTHHCLQLADPDAKIAALEALRADWQKGVVPLADSLARTRRPPAIEQHPNLESNPIT